MAKTMIGINSRSQARLADRLPGGITDTARKLADEEGILLRNLKGKGTGKGGQVTLSDVRREVNARKKSEEV